MDTESRRESRSSFFRQSAWMILATLAGGAGMILVHSVVGRCGSSAYAQFKALLGTFYLVTAAAGGLWTLFAQQTAFARSEEQLLNVIHAAKRCAWVILFIWALLAIGLYFAQATLASLWKLDNSASLWATWALGLLTLWTSIVRGMLQGRQNFAHLGWVVMLDGFGRLLAVSIIVIALGGLAAGAMLGAVIGTVAALLTGLTGLRGMSGTGDVQIGSTIEWSSWWKGFVPLAFSAAALQVLQNFDNVFWQTIIPGDKISQDLWLLGQRYSTAATIGFGLTQFTVPLAMVMLPKIARSVASGEKTDSLRLTLVATLTMGGMAALVCTLLPKLPLQIMFFNRAENWQSYPLVPWFAWSMLAFTLANVCLNDLFARRRFGVVPWVVVVAGAYAGTLWMTRGVLLSLEPSDAFRRVVMILGGFNVLLFGIVAVYSRGANSQKNPQR